MTLPFKSLVKPPSLKGCDELNTRHGLLRPICQPTATDHPYLHGGSNDGSIGGRMHAGVGERKN